MPYLQKKLTRIYLDTVCSTDNGECMIHRCPNCPSTDNLTNHLIFAEYDDDDEIRYKQQVNTDRSTLITITMQVSDFIGAVSDSLQNLTTHSYISKSQGSYLQQRKEDIDDEMLFSWEILLKITAL